MDIKQINQLTKVELYHWLENFLAKAQSQDDLSEYTQLALQLGINIENDGIVQIYDVLWLKYINM